MPNREILNGVNRGVFSALYRIGGLVGPNDEPVSKGLERVGTIGAVSGLQDELYKWDLRHISKYEKLPTETFKGQESVFRVGALGKTVKLLGSAAEAVTGVAKLGRSFVEDIEAKDTLLPRTLWSAVSSTAQIGIGNLAAGAAATATAAVCSTAIVPLAVGAAVGLGVAYGVGKIMDWISPV